MSKGQSVWTVLGAFALPGFEFLYGNGEAVLGMMAALLFFLIMDWISGSRAAHKDNSYASRYGIDGIFRSFFMLALPAGGNLLDNVFGLPGVIFGALTAGLLYHIIKSVVANAIRAGWSDYLPLWVVEPLLNWAKSELESKVKRAFERRGIPGKMEEEGK